MKAKIPLMAALLVSSVCCAHETTSPDAKCIDINLDSVGVINIYKDQLAGVARGVNYQVANYVRVVAPPDMLGIGEVIVIYNVKGVGDLPRCTLQAAHESIMATASCAVGLRDKRMMAVVNFDQSQNGESYEDRSRKVADFINAKVLDCKGH
jgi:hypothetical protein